MLKLLLMKHFLQTPEWAEFQKTLNKKIISNEDFQGYFEEHSFFKRLYIPYGPKISTKAELKQITDKIITEFKNEIDYIRLEPIGNITEVDLKDLGFVKAHKNIQPKHTIVNNLNKSEEEILADFSQSIRRVWRKNEKAGIKYRTTYNPDDIKYFLEMIHDVSTRTGMKPHPDNYFKQMAETLFPSKHAGIMLAEYENKPIASIIFFSNGETMYYAHAASYSKQRKLSPATSLAIFALLEANRTGHKYFDFYGITDSTDPNHPWAGFTHFKRSFGGNEIAYLGTWEYSINKPIYYIYRFLLKIYKGIK